MAEYKPDRIAQVIKVDNYCVIYWLVFIYTSSEWDKECSGDITISGKYIDVFSALDEVSALSRAKMVYPNLVIGDNQEGIIKVWR